MNCDRGLMIVQLKSVLDSFGLEMSRRMISKPDEPFNPRRVGNPDPLFHGLSQIVVGYRDRQHS